MDSYTRHPQVKRGPLVGSHTHHPQRPFMKPYLTTTGILFAAITVAHAYEAIARGHFHHTDLLVLVSAGFSIWAWRLLRKAAV